ncbi:MAG: DUF4870 domain-containing protein [Phycisphaerales bacterium]|nr:DUF4870 domain-containing protein [Phycisphaerales bacterium]
MSNENQPNQHADYRDPPLNAQGKAFDPDASTDERTFAMFMHLTLLLNLTGVGGPISFIAVLIMWMIKKDESPFLDDHGREAVNFQISLFIWALILGIGAVFTCGLSAIFLIAIPIVGAIGMIYAAVAANRGEFFRYPKTFRILK